MNRMLIILSLLVNSSVAVCQTAVSGTAKVNVIRVPAVRYPPLARQAGITGTVEINLAVRPNGSIGSATLESGHPMLKDAALESARQFQFECNGCREPLTPYRVAFRYELGPATFCESIDPSSYRKSSYASTGDAAGVVSVFDRPIGECDPAVTVQSVKVRSAKCLYLWHCGKRYPL